ncbi:hypothetical protein Syun_003458 [Stephania yunnanensis]|uniref:Uncharacterized protein n=1 Tax=Stephania yunnanensis TaxID=152371 RepID=A0AAP0L1G5_9MAGN
MASVSRLVSKDCSLDRNQPDLRFRANLGTRGRLRTSNVWRNGGKITTLNLTASPASSMLFHTLPPRGEDSECLSRYKTMLWMQVFGPSDVVDFVQQHLKDFGGFDVSEIANLEFGVFLDASRDYFEAWQLFVSCGDVIMTLTIACCAVITPVESGTSFPLKIRDMMLDYIPTLMGREESDGYPGSNLELLHTQSVALSVGDWFFDRVGISAIDCPYPYPTVVSEAAARRSGNRGERDAAGDLTREKWRRRGRAEARDGADRGRRQGRKVRGEEVVEARRRWRSGVGGGGDAEARAWTRGQKLWNGKREMWGGEEMAESWRSGGDGRVEEGGERVCEREKKKG